MPNPKRNRKRRQSGGNANAGPSARDASRIEAANLIASGNALLDAGNYDGAIADYARAVAADQEVALARRNRGKMAFAYASRGNAKAHASAYEDARADYEFAGELAQGLRPVAVTPKIANLVNRGNAKAEQGDYDGAIADYDRAIALNPNLADTYSNRGNAKRGKGDIDGAIADCDRAIALNPNDAGAYYNRGNAKVDKGDYDGAIADYNLAIDHNPNHAEAYNNRGGAKELKGDYDGAMADYDRAIDHNPNDAPPYYNRGNSKVRRGDIDGAIADYDRAIVLNPKYAEAYNNRGNSKVRRGDIDGAMADYDRAITLNPNHAEAYNNRGNAKSDKGDIDGAIADYDRAIAINPNDALAYNSRGNAKWRKGDIDGAIADYDRAIDIDSDHSYPYIQRGLAKGLQGDYDSAIEDLNLGIALDESLSQDVSTLAVLDVFKTEAEKQRYLAEVERLRSESEQFVAIADEAIAKNELLEAEVLELRAKLREQEIAGQYRPVTQYGQFVQNNGSKLDNITVTYYKNGPEYWPFINEWQIKRSKDSQGKIRAAIGQMRKGNFGDSKSVHTIGVFERRLHSGERIYYGKLDATSVVILHGGDKANSDQNQDIKIAQERLRDHHRQLGQAGT